MKNQIEFIKLLTGAQASLRAFVVSLMPGSSDVDDVLQDTNVVLWEKMSTFEEGSNFQAWAFTIAKNTVKAHWRMVKRNQSPAMNPELVELISETWHQKSEAASSSKVSKHEALDLCLERLKQKERELINARYMNLPRSFKSLWMAKPASQRDNSWKASC